MAEISEYMLEKLMAAGVGEIGQVCSAHSHLVNVLLEDGDLLTIHSPAGVRTPMSLVVSWPEEAGFGLEPGTAVCKAAHPSRILCGPLEISLHGLVAFPSVARVRVGISTKVPLEILTGHFTPPERIRSVYHHIRAADAPCALDALEQQLGLRLLRASRELTGALLRGDSAGGAAAATSLVGLGPGLTPAGDDYLQGFLLFAQADPVLRPAVCGVCEALRQAGALDTTTVSRAFWRHFLAGRVSEPVRQLVAAFNAEDWGDFACRVERLSLFGHTSGDDYLSGVWNALEHFQN